MCTPTTQTHPPLTYSLIIMCVCVCALDHLFAEARVQPAAGAICHTLHCVCDALRTHVGRLASRGVRSTTAGPLADAARHSCGRAHCYTGNTSSIITSNYPRNYNLELCGHCSTDLRHIMFSADSTPRFKPENRHERIQGIIAKQLLDEAKSVRGSSSNQLCHPVMLGPSSRTSPLHL